MKSNPVKTDDHQEESSFGLYIHWPFCVSKCPYCDFNSHVRETVDEALWEKALLKDLAFMGQLTYSSEQNRVLTSVFFGGGTPSLMPPRIVEKLLSALEKYWRVSPSLEITLEANPNSVEVARLKAFKQAGVNRLSLGIQSLHKQALSFLGRKHSVDEAVQALEAARKIFERFSFDLIYARSGQTLQDWEGELTRALALAGDHLSLYQLTIEPGTAFYTAHQRGDWRIPEEELAADLYQLTQEKMSASGRPCYEVSNYARPGQECRHNLVYWRYQDYAAIGPGAHGRLTVDGKTLATRAHKAPETWLKAVESHNGLAEKIPLTPEETFSEALLMGLRLREGVSWHRLESLNSLQTHRLKSSDALQSLIEEGLMVTTGTHLIVTEAGLLKLNALIRYLLKAL